MAERPMEHFTVDGVNIFEVTDAKARQDVSDLKDDFHSYHSELGAGYADQIVSGIQNEDSVPYNFRKVPYDATLEKVEGIVGCDVVLNQLAPILNSEKWAGNSQFGTCVFDGNKATYTITQKSGSQSVYISNVKGGIPLIKDHKYVVEFDATISQSTSSLSVNVMDTQWVSFPSVQANTKQHCAKVFNSANATGGNAYFGIYPSTGVGVDIGGTFVLENVVVIDLTAMFGTQIADYVYGLETATAGSGVAWLKEHFPEIFDSGYIAYNAGTMVHVSGLSAKRTVGFNQWDEQWEVGDINATTGENEVGYTVWRSKNYIPLIPQREYYICSSADSKNSRSRFYDATKRYIGYTPKNGSTATNHAFTPPDDACYMRISPNNSDIPNHDICINLSDTSRNGTYESYVQHEYPLDSSIDLHGILKLDANNQLYADGDVYSPSGQVSHRFALVDMGTLTWEKNDDRFISDTLTDGKAVVPNEIANLICAGYTLMSANNVYSGVADKIIAGGRASGMLCIWVNDTAYTDVASFKSAMSGVLLVYELATPTTEQAEPYTATQICDPNGTEEYISTTVAPVGHVTNYPLDIAGRLDNILSMPTANGTYTLRATVNNGKVTYSWVSA